MARPSAGHIFCLVVLLMPDIFVSVGGQTAGDKQLSNEQKLKEKLFKTNKYDKDMRPVYHHSNETKVVLEVIPRYLIELDEDKSLFSMDSWLVLVWNDDRLIWKPSDYDGLERLHLPDYYVWQPDLSVYNGHSSEIDPKKSSYIVTYNTGEVLMVPPAHFQTECSTKDTKGTYPNDVVTCNVLLGSWSHDGSQINVTLRDEQIYFGYFTNNHPKWEVLADQSSITRLVYNYNYTDEKYITIVTTFAMKRRTPQQLQIIWAPCVLVMILTLSMFWIPSGSGKKILLGTVLILILAMLLIYVGAITKSPWGSKKAVSFVESTMYAVGSAMVLELLVINLCSIVGPCRPPEIITRFLTGQFGKYVGVWAHWVNSVPGDRIQLKEDTEQIEFHPTPKDEWILFATAIDRLLFIVYIIVLATIHQV